MAGPVPLALAHPGHTASRCTGVGTTFDGVAKRQALSPNSIPRAGLRAQKVLASTEHQAAEERACSNSLATTSGKPAPYVERSISMIVLPPACAGSSLLLMTSTALASDMALSMAELQPSSPEASMHISSYSLSYAIELADVQLLPHIDVSPWQLLNFLLQHPFITLGSAAALYYLVPRLVRAGIRFIVVPAAIALALYIVSLNPSTAVDIARGAYNIAASNPVLVSGIILVGLAFALSPYLLLFGLVALLVWGVPAVPSFLQPVVPAPILQAQRQASELQQAVQRPFAALGQGIGEATSGLQRSIDSIFDRAPVRQLAGSKEARGRD